MSQSYAHDAVFTWPSTDPREVILTGSFDKWSRSVQLSKGPTGFSATVKLPWDQSHVAYKFLVDGRWDLRWDQPHEYDSLGNINNVYTLPPRPDPPPAEEERMEETNEAPPKAEEAVLDEKVTSEKEELVQESPSAALAKEDEPREIVEEAPSSHPGPDEPASSDNGAEPTTTVETTSAPEEPALGSLAAEPAPEDASAQNAPEPGTIELPEAVSGVVDTTTRSEVIPAALGSDSSAEIGIEPTPEVSSKDAAALDSLDDVTVPHTRTKEESEISNLLLGVEGSQPGNSDQVAPHEDEILSTQSTANEASELEEPTTEVPALQAKTEPDAAEISQILPAKQAADYVESPSPENISSLDAPAVEVPESDAQPEEPTTEVPALQVETEPEAEISQTLASHADEVPSTQSTANKPSALEEPMTEVPALQAETEPDAAEISQILPAKQAADYVETSENISSLDAPAVVPAVPENDAQPEEPATEVPTLQVETEPDSSELSQIMPAKQAVESVESPESDSNLNAPAIIPEVLSSENDAHLSVPKPDENDSSVPHAETASATTSEPRSSPDVGAELFTKPEPVLLLPPDGSRATGAEPEAPANSTANEEVSTHIPLVGKVATGADQGVQEAQHDVAAEAPETTTRSAELDSDGETLTDAKSDEPTPAADVGAPSTVDNGATPAPVPDTTTRSAAPSPPADTSTTTEQEGPSRIDSSPKTEVKPEPAPERKTSAPAPPVLVSQSAPSSPAKQTTQKFPSTIGAPSPRRTASMSTGDNGSTLAGSQRKKRSSFIVKLKHLLHIDEEKGEKKEKKNKKQRESSA